METETGILIKLKWDTSYPGIDLTDSTIAKDTRCWIKGILWPKLECRGTVICKVDSAQPMGLSQTFPPRPGEGKEKKILISTQEKNIY